MIIAAPDITKFANLIRESTPQVARVWECILKALSTGRKWALVNPNEMLGAFISKSTYSYFEDLGFKFYGHNETYVRIEFCDNAYGEWNWGGEKDTDKPNTKQICS